MRRVVAAQEIDYEERGTGRPLVLVHGLTTDRRILIDACEPVLDRPGLRRIYLDLPGHGASGANLVGASAEGLVAVLRAFVREVAGEGAAIIGHSYGAYLALGLARDLPTVSGLFLICPIVEPDLGFRRLPQQRYAVLEEGLEFADDAERETFNAEVMVHTPETLARFRASVDPAHRAVHRLFVDMVRGRYALAEPISGALARLAGPVHVLCGQNDYWAGFEDAMRIARLVPRCDLRILSGCGHFIPVEKPRELGVALAEWLEALGGSAPDVHVG